MMFERLILIGTGRIARGCAEVLADLILPLTCIEAEQSTFSWSIVSALRGI